MLSIVEANPSDTQKDVQVGDYFALYVTIS